MIKETIASLVLATTCALLAQTPDRAAFFKSPNELPANLPADGLYPTGQQFPFGFYSTGGGSDVQRGELLDMDQRFYDQNLIMRQKGINFIGPAYELNDMLLDDAHRCRTKAIYSVHTKGVEGIEIDGEKITVRYLDQLAKDKKEPPWDKITAHVKEIVSEVAEDPAIYAWNMAPEELRSWGTYDMKMLDVVVKAIREADPHNRPIMIYLPNHYGAKTIAPFFPTLDIVAKGAYVNYAGQKDSRIWVKWTMEQEREASSGKTCWLLPEMFQEASPEDKPLIPTWVRHDVFCGLACDAKGVLIFSASRRPNFSCRNDYLEAYFDAAAIINGPDKICDAYLFGEKRDDLSLDIISGPQTLHVKNFDLEADYSSITFQNLAWKQARYLTLVNSANEPVSAVLDGLPYGSDITFKNIINNESFTVPEGNVKLNFKPLEVKLFKVYIAAQEKQEEIKVEKPEIRKLGTVDCDIVEANPVVWNDSLLRLENIRWNSDSKHYYGNYKGHSYMRFVNARNGSQIGEIFGENLHMGNAFVYNGKMIVTCTESWGAKRIMQMESEDLIHWTKPRQILKGSGWQCYNTSICQAEDKLVMAFELGAPKKITGVPFTMLFAESTDGVNWTVIKDATYGKNKYTGGPMLRYFNGFYYLFYLNALENGSYETNVARSTDLVNWEESTLNPVLSASDDDKKMAVNFSPVLSDRIIKAENRNASDIDMCFFNGKLNITYSWGNQHGIEFLGTAEAKETEMDFCEKFFP